MRLQARLDGTGRVARRLTQLAGHRRQAVAAAVESGAELLRDDIRDSLSRGGFPAPGRPPRRRSGTLAESVTVERETGGLGATVGSDLDYARHLEFGTRQMAARPWLLPAFQRLAPSLARRILAAGRSRP